MALAMTAMLDLFPSRAAGPFGRRLKHARGARIPVTIVTGFLGAGKTTLVRRFLETPEGHGTAVVVNEFGTVTGLVTIEDLLEEIVGEIRDEFDVDEEQPVQELSDGSLLVQGSVALNELKDRYSFPFEETADYRTVAGLVLARLKRFPKGGEAISESGYKMTVVVLDGRRLRKIRIEGPVKRRAVSAMSRLGCSISITRSIRITSISGSRWMSASAPTSRIF